MKRSNPPSRARAGLVLVVTTDSHAGGDLPDRQRRTRGWGWLQRRSLWANNPLGNAGRWTAADGRKWVTECDTERTGRNGCRSYAEATVIAANGRGGFEVRTEFVFNNIVLFS